MIITGEAPRGRQTPPNRRGCRQEPPPQPPTRPGSAPSSSSPSNKQVAGTFAPPLGRQTPSNRRGCRLEPPPQPPTRPGSAPSSGTPSKKQVAQVAGTFAPLLVKMGSKFHILIINSASPTVAQESLNSFAGYGTPQPMIWTYFQWMRFEVRL